jgi:hypothetical protein
MSVLIAPGFRGGAIDQPDEHTRVAPMIGVVGSHTGITFAGFPASVPIEILASLAQTAAAPFEIIIASFAQTAVTPFEAIASIAQTAAAPLESIASIAQASLAPFEIIRATSQNRPQVLILAG